MRKYALTLIVSVVTGVLLLAIGLDWPVWGVTFAPGIYALAVIAKSGHAKTPLNILLKMK